MGRTTHILDLTTYDVWRIRFLVGVGELGLSGIGWGQRKELAGLAEIRAGQRRQPERGWWMEWGRRLDAVGGLARREPVFTPLLFHRDSDFAWNFDSEMKETSPFSMPGGASCFVGLEPGAELPPYGEPEAVPARSHVARPPTSVKAMPPIRRLVRPTALAGTSRRTQLPGAGMSPMRRRLTVPSVPQ